VIEINLLALWGRVFIFGVLSILLSFFVLPIIREPYMLEDSCNLIKEEIRRYKAMEKKILKNAEDVVIKSGKADML